MFFCVLSGPQSFSLFLLRRLRISRTLAAEQFRLA